MNLSKLVIVLEKPKYSGNIGMIARLAANFSLPPIRILGEKQDLNFEMEWMAIHAKDELNRIQYYKDVKELRYDLELLIGTSMIKGKDRGIFLELGSSFLPKLDGISGLNGIAFGREDRGLSHIMIDECDYMVDFDLPGEQKSMNLANAVAYVLSIIYNQPIRNSGVAAKNPTEAGVDLQGFFKYAGEIFARLNLNEFHGHENIALKRFKKIIEASPLTDGDKNFLFRIFRRIDERIKE